MPDWQVSAVGHVERFTQALLRGDARVEAREFDLARAEVARTGRPELVARVERVLADQLPNLHGRLARPFVVAERHGVRVEGGGERLDLASVDEAKEGRDERAAGWGGHLLLDHRGFGGDDGGQLAALRLVALGSRSWALSDGRQSHAGYRSGYLQNRKSYMQDSAGSRSAAGGCCRLLPASCQARLWAWRRCSTAPAPSTPAAAWLPSLRP